MIAALPGQRLRVEAEGRDKGSRGGARGFESFFDLALNAPEHSRHSPQPEHADRVLEAELKRKIGGNRENLIGGHPVEALDEN